MEERSDGDELAVVVRVLRAYRGWEQKRLAAAAGAPAGQVCEWERGKKVPQMQSLQRIIAALELPASAIGAALAFVEAVRAESEGAAAGGEGAGVAAGGAAASGLAEGRRSLADRLFARLEGEAERRGRREFPEGEEGCRRARQVGARLEPYAPAVRRLLVAELEEFADLRGCEACERLCAESERAAAHSASAALEAARLAVRVARLAPGEEGWRSGLEGHALGFVANAQRVGGDLPGAEETLGRAVALCRAGTGGGRRLPDGVRLLDLEASLRRAQRRLPEALALLERALELTPSGHAAARLHVIRAKTLEALGEANGAMAALEKAAGLLEPAYEPRLWWVLRQNLAVNLWHLGRHQEAAALLPELRRGAEWLGNELDRVRLRWVEGEVAAGLGRAEEAIGALEEVRAFFAARDNGYDTALATLDLAVVLAEQGRTAEVRTLAAEMEPIFRAQRVHREGLAVLRLFRDAAEREALTVELARRCASFVRRSEYNPNLRFEGDLKRKV